MEIKFKLSIGEKMNKLCEGLKKLGMITEMPPIIRHDEMEIGEVGKMLPKILINYYATIKFTIPEKFVQITKEE